MADTQEPTITAPASAAPAADSASSPVVVASPASNEAGASSKEAVVANPTSPATATTTENPPSAASESVKTEAKVETPTPPVTESILGDEKPKEEVKVETKVDAKPETKADAPQIELPTYEAFKLPENVSLDKEPLDAFSRILGEIETGKLDHAGMQAKGQALIDLAAKATTDSINRLNDYYVNIHETQKKDWHEASYKDAELGNGNDKDFREMAGRLNDSIYGFAGTAEQQKEFRTLMKDTGVGNHPSLLRMLNNMQKKIDTYTKEKQNTIVPAAAPAPSKVKPHQLFYSGGS